MGIAQEIEDAIDEILTTIVSSSSASLCGAMVPIAVTGASIYIILMGFAIARGEAGEPLHTFVSRSFRMALISGLALSAGEYQTTIIEGSAGLERALIESLSGMQTVGALIDEFAKPFSDLGEQIWNQAVVGFWPNFGLIAAAGMVAIAQCFIFCLGLGFYLLAKVAVAVVLAVGPAFILCAMWPGTQKYTESWIGQVLNYIILKVLVATSIVMLTSFVSQYAQHIAVTTDATNVISATTSLLLACGALAIVMLNLPQIAAALSGGVSIAGIGRTIAHALLHRQQRVGSGTGVENPDPAKSGGEISRSARSGDTDDIKTVPRRPLFQRNTIERLQRSR